MIPAARDAHGGREKSPAYIAADINA